MSTRRRLERLQGVAFDAILVAIAVAVSEDAVQAWLMEHPPLLYHGLAALHIAACPALLVATAMGYGKTGDPAEIMLLVAAGHDGPLVEVGLPVGVLIDYLPVRVVIYYVRDSPRWEIWTIAASVLHLLYRIAAAE